MNNKGFTLIELIVVIAIIALLASIVLVSISDVQIKGRNAGVIEQVSEYQKAVALYVASNNGNYPNVGDTDPHCVGASGSCVFVGDSIATDNTLDALEEFISGLPFVTTLTLTGVGTYSGLIYQCNDANCRTANFYWPEINVSSCTKGTTYLDEDDGTTNGVLCTELAEGGSN